jgi:hypothetical protein
VVDGGRRPLQLLRVSTLCDAIIRIVSSPERFANRTFTLAEETITLREWVARLAGESGRHPLLVPVPSSWIRGAIALMEAVSLTPPIDRANLDGFLGVRIVDAEPSMRELGLIR